jgi:hypothetical protein
MSEYFLPSTFSAESILVFLLLLALAVATTWLAVHYYWLKRDFDSMLQKMGHEYAAKIEEERRKIQRIPYQLEQIELLVKEIRKCCAGGPVVQQAESSDENEPQDEVSGEV